MELCTVLTVWPENFQAIVTPGADSRLGAAMEAAKGSGLMPTEQGQMLLTVEEVS